MNSNVCVHPKKEDSIEVKVMSSSLAFLSLESGGSSLTIFIPGNLKEKEHWISSLVGVLLEAKDKIHRGIDDID